MAKLLLFLCVGLGLASAGQQDLQGQASALLEKYGVDGNALNSLFLEEGPAPSPSIFDSIDELLTSVEARISVQRQKVVSRGEAAERAIDAKLAEATKNATQAVDIEMAKLVASKEQGNTTAELKHVDIKTADASYQSARGETQMAKKLDAKERARIAKRALHRQQHIDKMLWLKLQVLSREIEIVQFVKYLVDGSTAQSAVGLPPPMKRGLYCDAVPFTNNTFESDPASRNGARLRFGHASRSCINWKNVGGIDTNCCQVPSSTLHSSHAPWCWVSETEYAYCWRRDLEPAASGWMQTSLKPLRDHYTAAFNDSSINDCGKDCVELVPHATTDLMCMEQCFRDDRCAGVTLLAGGQGCLKVVGFGTCDVRDPAKPDQRLKTGFSADFVCSQDDRVVYDAGNVGWLKIQPSASR